MRIFLTGCTGFVGKFVLLELLLRAKKDDTIICLLRGKKDQTAQQRWKQIQEDSLFTGMDFSRTEIVEGDLNSLDEIKWINEEPDVLVHSAANVKTLDPYPELYRDNVLGVQKICQMCIKWSISRLHLVSTCYVHPRGTVGKSELLSDSLPRSLFTTDYTYTKYLGECATREFSNKFHISILRLSCVGAPCNWLDAHPTPGAMAHLGFISLAMRGKLEILRIPSTMSLSTIPVNIVARVITDDILVEELGDNPLVVKQICANPLSQWNISIPQLFSIMQGLCHDLSYIKVLNVSSNEFKSALQSHWGYLKYTPWGYKAFRFHEEVNDFLSKFADGQRFESSVPKSYFPKISDEQICEQTCLYVARGIHQFQMERGHLIGRLDKFWGSMDEHYIEGQIVFKKPLVFHSKQEAITKIYNCLGAYRPFFADPYASKLKYNGSLGPHIGWSSEEAKSIKRSGQIELLGDYTSVRGFKMTGHHGIGDGIAFMSLLPRVDSLDMEEPEQSLVQSSVRSRSLTMTEEIYCIAYYLASLVLVLVEKEIPYTRVQKNSEMSRGHFNKIDGKSFTCSLIEKSFTIIRTALKKDTVVYCIPATITGPRERGLRMPENSFVPILVPWSSRGGRMQEMCLNSKGAKFMCWLLCQFVSYTDSKWLVDLFMNKVDVVLSSLMASDRPLKNIDSFHFLSPTKETIPFTINAMTIGTETFFTCASSNDKLTAKDLMKELISK